MLGLPGNPQSEDPGSESSTAQYLRVGSYRDYRICRYMYLSVLPDESICMILWRSKPSCTLSEIKRDVRTWSYIIHVVEAVPAVQIQI